MKELLEFVVTSLVDDASSVSVNVKEGDKFIDCFIKVNENDIGKVIGRNGKIANAIRTLARACAKKTNKKVNVKIEK